MSLEVHFHPGYLSSSGYFTERVHKGRVGQTGAVEILERGENGSRRKMEFQPTYPRSQPAWPFHDQ